jgi:energy-coupling factor transporter ATP-binding protein EcfA2
MHDPEAGITSRSQAEGCGVSPLLSALPSTRRDTCFLNIVGRYWPPCLTSGSQQGSISRHMNAPRVPDQPNGARGKPLVRATIGISAPFRLHNTGAQRASDLWWKQRWHLLDYDSSVQLTRLVLTNFKAFKHAEIELPLTGVVLLVGANNVGKSALLSAIDILANREGRVPHRHSGSSEGAEIRARFTLTDDDRNRLFSIDGQDPHRWLETAAFQWIDWHYVEPAPGVLSPAGLMTSDTSGNETVIGQIDYAVGSATGQFSSSQIPNLLRANELPSGAFPLSPHGSFSGEVIADATGTYFGPLSDLLNEWRQNVYHFRALRTGTDRSRQLRSLPDLDPTGLNLPEALTHLYHNDVVAWNAVTNAAREVVPDVGELVVPTSGDQVEVAFQDPHLGVRHNIKDLGTGVEQVLLTAYVGVTQPAGSLVIVEEPETNLHPEAQRRLLLFLLEWSAQRLFLVSTHSTVFLDRGAGDVPVWLLQRQHGVATVSRANTSLGDVLREIGVRLSDVLSADRVLVLEGPTDADILTAWFPILPITPRLALASGHGGDAAWQTEALRDWVEKADVLERRILFLRDRDELPAETIHQLEGRGTVRVFQRREIENYLLDADAIVAVLQTRLLGAGIGRSAPSPHEVDELLTALSQVLQPVTVLKRVASRLAPFRPLDRASVARIAEVGPTLDTVQADISTRIPSGDLIADVRRIWAEEEEYVSSAWATRWRELAPGSDLLAMLWHKFGLGFDKSRDGPLLAQSMASKPGEIADLLDHFLRE